MSSTTPLSPTQALSLSRPWLIAAGAFSIFTGFLAITFPLLFSLVIAQFLGAFALVSGVIALFVAVFSKEATHRVLDVITGLIRIAAGITLFLCVESSVQVITLIFAVFLIVEGIFFMAGAFKLRQHAGWIWTLINGFAALALGIMVYARWPSDSAWVLGLFFGINLVFSGMSLLMLGLAVRKPATA